MEQSNSQDNGQLGGRRSGKRPQQMKFMFIDSSDHGTNAKPDKTVRSFVMHQARRSKQWSTRQKQSQSPNSASGFAPKSSRSKRFPGQASGRADGSSSEDLGSVQELDSNPSAWNDWASHTFGSPVSNSYSSSTNSREGSQPCITPLSSRSSVCDIPDCNGESCDYSHPGTALAKRDAFALGTLDPFDCLAVQMDEKTSAMLDHFVSNLSPRLIPVDVHQSSNIVTTQWVGNSLRNTTSAPFTYALLTASAHHLQAMGAAKLEDTLTYKASAISEVNTLLSDAKTSVADENIAAVFMLLCLEESSLAPGSHSKEDASWSATQRAIHLNGLRTMIQQRGGLSALSSNRCLQVFILMHSIAHSISTFQRPYTTLLDPNGRPQQYDIPSFRSRPSSARILRLFRDVKLDTALFDIISNIVVFSGDISSWFEDKKCPLDPLELQKHCSLLMYRLFDWYSTPQEEGAEVVGRDEVKERSPIDQSICLALLIFLVRVSQPFDPSYRAMILTTVKKLRAALTKCSIFRWAKSPDLLLWTLTMGALAAQGSSEAGFFSQYCSVAFADAGFDEKTNAEEMLDRMRKCLWIPILFDQEVKKLWMQIGIVSRGDVEDVLEEDPISPEIREDDVVGLLTSTRFFSEKNK